MDRRTFLAGTGAVLLAAPLAAEAQQAGKVYRKGGSELLKSRLTLREGRRSSGCSIGKSAGWVNRGRMRL